MAPIDLNLLRAFALVHETGSFSSAADALRVPRSTVSRAIATLEEQLGADLFHRTTRKVAITDEGRALFDRIAPSLAVLDRAVADLPQAKEEVAGVVRLTSTADLGAAVLAEASARFVARYPKASVDVVLTPEVVDLGADGFDFALRVSQKGKLPSSPMVATKVGTLRFQLYASPTYLARRGVPRTRDELMAKDWVSFRTVTRQRLGQATFAALARATPRITADDMFFLRELVRAGAGVGMLPAFFADADVASGVLSRVLPSFTLENGTVFLVAPARKHVPARAAAFRALLLELLRQRPLTG